MMIPQRAQELSAGSKFSFTSSRDSFGHGRKSSPYVADHGPWAQRIKDNSGDRRASFSNYDRRKVNDDGEEEDLTWLVKEEENRSGTPSPTLWNNASGSPAAPRSAGASPAHGQAGQLARFRQEMLELVRDVPESGYELSLRDMVQLPTPPLTPPRAATEAVAPAEVKKLDKKKKTTNQKVKQIARTERMVNGGFLLKMFTPPSMVAGIGGGKRGNSGGSYSFARVSPKQTPPPSPPASAVTVAGGGKDGEWWRKNELSESSGGSSSNSSSKSSSRGGNGNCGGKSRGWKKGSCYSFLLGTQSGAEEI